MIEEHSGLNTFCKLKRILDGADFLFIEVVLIFKNKPSKSY
jgi:hypothetical protein